MPELFKLILLALLGIFAGFLNITAGGGSLLTLPFLIFLGLPVSVANGTNRIAILIQNIFATARFYQFKVIPQGTTLVAVVPALAGSIIGAHLAVDINELLFKRILAGIMILVLAIMLFNPGRKVPNITVSLNTSRKFFMALSFFGIGIYGGFIQAGIGFLIIMILTAVGYDLVRTNALKVLVVLIFTPVVLFIFILEGQVDFVKGLVLAAGSTLGGWIATRFVVEKGHRFIRWIVMVAGVGFAVKLFLG
ncbi:MAG: sulfite exporter TauE/SafE family protein [bacterium]